MEALQRTKAAQLLLDDTMDFSLSTSYFSGQRLLPEVMAARTRQLGFTQVELGYFVRDVELEAWERSCAAEGLTVSSVHAFCPMPIGMPQLGPEVYSLATPDVAEREAAIVAMRRTLDCAVRFHAKAVVTHGGRVALRMPGLLFGSKPYHSRLSESFRASGGLIDDELVNKERQLREAVAGRWIDALSFSLDKLLPHFEAAGVILSFENLPGLEAFPDPAELAFLRQRFPSPMLGAWYDIGHGERKARVGDWPVFETLQLTGEFTAGVHIHDVRGLDEDHCAPGEGGIDYSALLPLLKKPGLVRVFEPSPHVSTTALQRGLALIQQLLTERSTP